MRSRARSVVLLSGGMDSAVALATAHKVSSDLHAVFVDYGQRAVGHECLAARRLARLYRAELHEVSTTLPWVADHPLLRPDGFEIDLDSPFMGEARASDVVREEGDRTAFIHLRNLVFLSHAAACAATVGATTVYLGWDWRSDANAKDKSPEFMSACDTAVNLGLEPKLPRMSLVSPVMGCSRSDVIVMARSLRVPVARTWSCYNSLSAHCGVCSPCWNRRKAYAYLRMKDPTKYVSLREVRKAAGVRRG